MYVYQYLNHSIEEDKELANVCLNFAAFSAERISEKVLLYYVGLENSDKQYFSALINLLLIDIGAFEYHFILRKPMNPFLQFLSILTILK